MLQKYRRIAEHLAAKKTPKKAITYKEFEEKIPKKAITYEEFEEKYNKSLQERANGSQQRKFNFYYPPTKQRTSKETKSEQKNTETIKLDNKDEKKTTANKSIGDQNEIVQSGRKK